MPELPEVETVRQDLRKILLNKEIKEVEVFHKNILENINKEDFKLKLKNQKIKEIKRRGKWLIFELTDYLLLSHLRMEGKFKYLKNKELKKHDHIIFEFKDQTYLIYEDVRKFGKMALIKKDKLNDYLSKLGPEPFDINPEALKEQLKNKTIAIKTALLDQNIIAGIGNIYVDEILFASKVNPRRKAKEVTLKELEKIINNSIRILTNAIKNRGTTIRSYTSNGKEGENQKTLYVYQREDKPCLICNEKIKKIKINGRGTHYCKNCQK